MAYTYCDCGHPLEKPSIEEDLTESYVCCVCRRVQPQMQTTEEWLIELEERISSLEESK